ncbi:MAG: hypothetical protein KJ697_04925 [Nanoarchaeota archaeon]|nr:hypothetical protein [Nanoarchaeota archaeon]MBU4124067.1 hypothetical protein [Nanoarchaeota archaeon]
MKFVERENEIIKIIKKLSEFNMIVVGRYAVSARAKHRFSVDCDIVIPKDNLEKIIELLDKERFEKSIIKDNLDNEYGGEFIRYVKKIDGLPVSVDILANSLTCRTTNASWSFDYILKNSDKIIISGIESSVECLVPSKELLLAFKIHSGRKTDLRDIIMLKDADWNAVKNHTNRGDLIILKKQIGEMIENLDDKNLIDSLKGLFQLKEGADKMIKDTKKKLNRLLDIL